eukprot:scaffold120823_cov36-Phaeocystis_antarctica.AAC.1
MHGDARGCTGVYRRAALKDELTLPLTQTQTLTKGVYRRAAALGSVASAVRRRSARRATPG